MNNSWKKLTNFAVLCGNRLTQMTKTYNDIEAVTRLLEEKEQDLELAARIGQTLLEKNKDLEEKNEKLEELLAKAQETLQQLKHELSMKEALLKFYTQDAENREGHGSLEDVDGAVVPHLQKKVKTLEQENLHLRLETSELQQETDTLEEKEARLVNDCVQQLEELHQQLEQYARELAEKTGECSSQKEEITSLLHQIVALQKRNKTLMVENLDLTKTLEASQDSQRYLSHELADVKEKNEELLALMEENQEEIKQLRNKGRPNAVRHTYMSSSLLSIPSDSLASELECSLRSEMEHPHGYSPMERRKHNWKVFETAKAAKQAAQGRPCSTGFHGPCQSSPGFLGVRQMDGCESSSVSARSSMYFSDGESGFSDTYSADLESLYGSNQKVGRPGVPGSNDLQTALRRLSLRRANELNELDYKREERERQERGRADSETDHSEVDASTPGRCHTPDSLMSGGSSNLSYLSLTGSSNNPYFKMPEKLQIVKPLEGSVTLRQWQQLATPHLGGIFEQRPGVQIKGERKLDLETEVYTLSDYEEDDEDDHRDYPSRFQESHGIYTFTDSTVKHPSQADRTTSSQKSSTPRVATGVHGKGTSTYSMSLGLASILNERDLLTTPTEEVPSSTARTVSSNPTRFDSLVSDGHFKPETQTSTSMTFSTTTKSISTVLSPSSWLSGTEQGRSLLASPSAEAGSAAAGKVLKKLKDTSFNLYGYLATGAANIAGVVNRPDSLPVTSVSSVSTAAVSRSSEVTPTATQGIAECRVTVLQPSDQTTGTKSPNLSALFSRGTAGGVIGALADFKRSGML